MASEKVIRNIEHDELVEMLDTYLNLREGAEVNNIEIMAQTENGGIGKLPKLVRVAIVGKP